MNSKNTFFAQSLLIPGSILSTFFLAAAAAAAVVVVVVVFSSVFVVQGGDGRCCGARSVKSWLNGGDGS